MVGDKQRGHLGFADADADAVARDPRLGDFEHDVDAVAVADAYLVVRQAVDREILPECARRQIAAAQFAFPVLVGRKLVDQHRAVLTAVSLAIALAVAVDVETPHHAWTRHRDFAEPGVEMRPFHSTSFGIPTLTNNSFAIPGFLRPTSFVSAAGCRRSNHDRRRHGDRTNGGPIRRSGRR